MCPSSTSTAADSSPASRLSTLPEGVPALTLGDAAATWAHEWFIQPNGPRAGKPFRLTLDQYRFLLWWYAVDPSGAWLFHHGARRLAKGSGKSPFAAVLALIEFCGPCRLERFDDRVPGGCRAKPVTMPWVQIAATAESQTANTMRMVRAFAPKGSKLVDAYHLDVGKTKYYKLPEGTLEVITSSVVASEGAESSFVVRRDGALEAGEPGPGARRDPRGQPGEVRVADVGDVERLGARPGVRGRGDVGRVGRAGGGPAAGRDEDPLRRPPGAT